MVVMTLEVIIRFTLQVIDSLCQDAGSQVHGVSCGVQLPLTASEASTLYLALEQGSHHAYRLATGNDRR